MTVYLDCNATTPIDPRVLALVVHCLEVEYGNAGSRTHEMGTRAKQMVEHARDQIAGVVNASRDEIVFTSGATESNNIAILGLEAEAERSGRKHVISTQIEHKSVLEPLEYLRAKGFEVELVPPLTSGAIDPEYLSSRVRPDTLLVSVMGANNETGVIQPIAEICQLLESTATYFHVDAAQAFGKEIDLLRNKRIDLISVSGHKVFAPKGVGALITRRRKYNRPPLQPLQFGGGQERGLRPGTVPVHLVAGLGLAAEYAVTEAEFRREICKRLRSDAISCFTKLGVEFNGDPNLMQSHVLNFSIPELDSEAVILALKDSVAVSNGSACTSSSYSPSHVLASMNFPPERILGAIRLSWSHMIPTLDWSQLFEPISILTR